MLASSSLGKPRKNYVLLGIFLGILGIHNFYAGFTVRAIAQLLITMLIGWLIIPLIAVWAWAILEVCIVSRDAKGVNFRGMQHPPDAAPSTPAPIPNLEGNQHPIDARVPRNAKGKFLVNGRPTAGPDTWRGLLASPDRHWKTGYSAKALAHSWEDAQGFPPEVRQVFSRSGFPILNDIELVAGYPEHKVPLPGGRRASQNDIFVLGKAQGQLIAITVEGKVNEHFGEPVSDWLRDCSAGKLQRLQFLREMLELPPPLGEDTRYQLWHRTVSALILAKEQKATSAMMLVHSFSQAHNHFTDYRAFVLLFGQTAKPNSVVHVGKRSGLDLYLAWVTGARRFLKV